jgi:hypothetical protein
MLRYGSLEDDAIEFTRAGAARPRAARVAA